MTLPAPTTEQVRQALACIPASLPRDEWAKVAMAIKSEYPDDTGFDLFDTWSQQASDHYDAKGTRDTWRSIKAGGGVGLGTLFHLAKAHGWRPEPQQPHAQPSPEEMAQQAQARAQRQAQEQAQREAAQARAAQQATTLWDSASPEGGSPYLTRKGVGGHGVRFAADGWLLVPVRDGQGVLHNVQRIAPSKPASGPDKLFLKGGRKTGLWHLLGLVTEHTQALLVAEGYATAASLHEATGHPVAVAFDAGNLLHVCKALRGLHPGLPLLVCGDDDHQTPHNPGRAKATAAAKAVRAAVVFPEGLAEGGTDFNDQHQAQGLGAVQRTVQAALNTWSTQQAKTTQTAAGQPAAAIQPPAAWDRYTVNDQGVWFEGVDQDGKPKAPEWVCSRLDVLARTRDHDDQNWGYLLSFADPAGTPKQWAMPASMLSGDGNTYRALLYGMGLLMSSAPRARNHLTQYIQSRTPGELAMCTDRIGWHGHAFVLPKQTIGDNAQRIVFQSDSQMENTFRVRGAAQQWRDSVGALCRGNSRLAFAVATAFAGPLLRPAQMESGGFHYRGDSSSGKTTALKVAASVYGGANFLQRWRTTDNALEAIAAQHCDSTLILDELAQVDPKTAGECAYMLANEQSKARSTRNGAPRARLSWRLLFLSAGELGLADHMAEGMKRTRTGQEVRMADIPADAGAGMGAFENLHGLEGGAAFARHVVQAATAYHGAAGQAFITWCVQHADGLGKRVRQAVGAMARQWVPEGASGQVERVAARFALVGVAGELATEAGLTGWDKGEGEAAARSCFNAWLAARGGSGNGEVKAMLRAVKGFIEAHGEGRFTWWHRAADDHAAKTLHRAGVRRMLNADGDPIKTNSQHGQEYGDRMPVTLGESVSVEYFILPEVFKAEVCKGFDHVAVAKVLADHACLEVKEAGRFDVSMRLPGIGKARCYHLKNDILALEI